MRPCECDRGQTGGRRRSDRDRHRGVGGVGGAEVGGADGCACVEGVEAIEVEPFDSNDRLHANLEPVGPEPIDGERAGIDGERGREGGEEAGCSEREVAAAERGVVAHGGVEAELGGVDAFEVGGRDAPADEQLIDEVEVLARERDGGGGAPHQRGGRSGDEQHIGASNREEVGDREPLDAAAEDDGAGAGERNRADRGGEGGAGGRDGREVDNVDACAKVEACEGVEVAAAERDQGGVAAGEQGRVDEEGGRRPGDDAERGVGRGAVRLREGEQPVAQCGGLADRNREGDAMGVRGPAGGDGEAARRHRGLHEGLEVVALEHHRGAGAARQL